jgi:hypothetical protein
MKTQRPAPSGAQFFAFGSGHYWRDGRTSRSRLDLWREFNQEPQSEAGDRSTPEGGHGWYRHPAQLREHFRAYEEAGVDQLILLQQCGNYRQEHVCDSLDLFARTVLPEFRERAEAQEERKRRELDPYVAAALRRMPPLDPLADVPAVDAYPRLWSQEAPARPELTPDRRPGMAALWQMQVAGAGKKKGENA